MLKLKSIITILLILLGLSLFYLWYNMWHKNISNSLINKNIIEEAMKEPQKLPQPQHVSNQISMQPPNNTSSKQTQPSSNIKTSIQKSQTTKPIKYTNKTPYIRNKKLSYIKPKKLLKTKSSLAKRPSRYIPKPIEKTILKQAPPYQNNSKNIKLKIQQKPIANTKTKFLMLKNGAYQAGAFKYLSDAISLSLELKAKGNKTKIIHQDGLYKVIVY